jgi:hypothetical protein
VGLCRFGFKLIAPVVHEQEFEVLDAGLKRGDFVNVSVEAECIVTRGENCREFVLSDKSTIDSDAGASEMEPTVPLSE